MASTSKQTKSVRIPAEDYELLKQHASRVYRTLTQVLSRAIKSYCKDGKPA